MMEKAKKEAMYKDKFEKETTGMNAAMEQPVCHVSSRIRDIRIPFHTYPKV